MNSWELKGLKALILTTKMECLSASNFALLNIEN